MISEQIISEILRWTANISILYVGVVLGLFILVYGTRRWRKYAGGRAVMQFVVSLELLILLAIAGNWTSWWQGWSKELVRDVVYLFIAVSSTRLFWVLLTRWSEVLEAVGPGADVDIAERREEGEVGHRG